MLDSILRTVVPYLVGALIVLAAKVGLDINPDMTITEAVTLGVSAVYYWAARFLEQRWPSVGRVLLSFGLARGGAPVYARFAKGGKVRAPRR